MKKITLLILILAAAIGGWFGYQYYAAPTRIAFVNYMDFMYDEIVQANDNSAIHTEQVTLTENTFKSADNYDALYLFAHGGVRLNEQQKEQVKSAIESGTAVIYSSPIPTPELEGLGEEHVKYVNDCLKNSTPNNIRRMLNYTRSVFDGKKLFVNEVTDPFLYPKSYYYHLEDEEVFAKKSDYITFLKARGSYTEGGKNIALVASQFGASSETGFINQLVNKLEAEGHNVFPIVAYGPTRISYVRDINPDLVIYNAHGRFGGEMGIQALKEANIPMLAPVVVFAPNEMWRASKQGMDGGLLSMNVGMPELDGGIVPYVIGAQFKNERGLYVFRGIDKRIDTFVELANKYLALKDKPNAEKKVAIFYLKEAGKNALVAESLEVVPSLWNLLNRMQKEGYDLGELPATPAELEQLIQEKGPVFGSYAKGSIEDFRINGDPELLSKTALDQMLQDELASELVQQLQDKYGPTPGKHMSFVDENGPQLMISRIKLGNIVLLPVPPAGGGDDEVEMVHGTKSPPPYPYVGAYLWARTQFDADALMHFGTHGSVEFTPEKQVALSETDWPDALLAGTPHFYVYVINNIGEATIAKRRSYAVMQSHLTPPLTESGLYGPLLKLDDLTEKYWNTENAVVQAEYHKTIDGLIREADLAQDLNLQLSEDRLVTQKQLYKIHHYLHDLEMGKITHGLHVLGEPYTEQEVTDTVHLMALDALVYNQLKMDQAKGKVTEAELADAHFMEENYRYPSTKMINAILSGTAPETYLSADQQALLNKPKAEPHGHSHGHGHGGHTHRHENPGPNHGMLAPLRNPAGQTSAHIELKLHDDKGDLELWLTDQAGKPYDLPATATITVLFEQVANQPEKSGTSVTLAPRNLQQNEDENGTPNMRTGQMTNYFIFPGDTGADASWLKGLEFKASALVSYTNNGEPFRTDAFALIPHSHDNGHGSHSHHGGHAHHNTPKKKPSQAEAEYQRALEGFKKALLSVNSYKQNLINSPKHELDTVINSLNGGYTEPQSGGDPAFNPEAVPSGRNHYSINAEKVPSKEAFNVAKKLVDQLLERQISETGKYPERVAVSLWSSEFIRQEGVTIAEIFYLLGVEPVADRRGTVHDVKLIPIQELGRPRIDVVVQTSGQFRDIAASRIYLINRAVKLAAEAKDGETEFTNYVQQGVQKAEELMKERGASPAQARKLSNVRVFGGLNGNYGAGIMGMVEDGDSWESENQVADRYLMSMGAMYGKGIWGNYQDGAFEAALSNAEMVIQPRSANTWGALSLDHVYEFMGGISNAIRRVSGNDPTAYFSDMRSPENPVVQSLEDAIWMESRTTLLNPKYIKAMQAEGATAADTFAETFRNTFGWEVMKTSAVDPELWDNLNKVYVEDIHGLDMEEYFRGKNPYAYQEITAIMLETVRKGYWDPNENVQQQIATLHAELVKDHDAGCSGFVCDNKKLREFISTKLDNELAESLNEAVDAALNANVTEAIKGMELSKAEPELQKATQQSANKEHQAQKLIWLLAIIGVIIVFITYNRLRK